MRKKSIATALVGSWLVFLFIEKLHKSHKNLSIKKAFPLLKICIKGCQFFKTLIILSLLIINIIMALQFVDE